ncbi:hypothetical protein BBFGKLBO_02218 [Synechococcus sp. CBW1107]|jgi:hypothetical protein|nr:hypothetical protein BBFGKLBO_02218 [Synechococcus sp. CBW1107]
MVDLIPEMDSISSRGNQQKRLLLAQGDPELFESHTTIGWIRPSTILCLEDLLVLLLESLDPFLD